MAAFLSEWASPYEWAAMYRSLGLQVVPGRPGDKRPVVGWLEWQNLLVPQSQFDRWFGETGEFRMSRAMGLLTGACSRALASTDETEGLFLVDLDVGEGKIGLTWWRTFVEVELNGIEPQTWRARSGGGGLHIYFLAPLGWVPPTFKTPVGVDLRGQGGYVVTAPSMHPNGQFYEWQEGFEPWACELAMAPPELCEAVDRLRAEHGGTSTRPREHVPSVGAKNAFGLDVDDREHKLQAVVWAAVVDLYREAPIPPSQAVQEAEIERIWTQYEATTKSRLPAAPGASNADLLEREGRGLSELRKKWVYAMGRWDSKVAEAARIPKAEPDNPACARVGDEPADPSHPSPGLIAPRSLGDVTAEPKPRRWLVDGWLPHADATLFGAKGGLGKSLLALQLACGRAIGSEWVGLPTVKGRTLFVTCEDTDDEIDRRFHDVRRGLGYAVGNPFNDALVWSRKFQENRLAVRDGAGNLTLGPFMPGLLATLQTTQPSLLILDTAADVYAGNENDRQEVNWFVKTAIGSLIEASGDALGVLILAHPSKAEGSQYSGSTAWEGAVRSRLFLDQPEDGAAVERTLARAKANYAGDDAAALSLMWADGVFNRLPDGDAATRALAQVVVNEVDYAWRSGRPYSDKRGHERYLDGLLVKKLTMPDQPRELVQAAVRYARENDLIVKSRNNTKRGWKTPYAE